MPAVAVRLIALWLTVGLTFAACGGGGEDEGPAATVPATAAPATSAPADPYAIPATIDVAYVQRVFDALDQIRGEVVKEFLTKRQLTPEMGARLGTVYNAEELERQLHARVEQLKRDFSVFKQPPGIRRTVVKRIMTGRPDCISVEAEFDNSTVLKKPGPPVGVYLGLQPTEPALDPEDINPTPYSIFAEDPDLQDPCVRQQP